MLTLLSAARRYHGRGGLLGLSLHRGWLHDLSLLSEVPFPKWNILGINQVNTIACPSLIWPGVIGDE